MESDKERVRKKGWKERVMRGEGERRGSKDQGRVSDEWRRRVRGKEGQEEGE